MTIPAQIQVRTWGFRENGLQCLERQSSMKSRRVDSLDAGRLEGLLEGLLKVFSKKGFEGRTVRYRQYSVVRRS